MSGRVIREACGTEIFLFDIDNTLAVLWPEGKIPDSA